MTCHFNAGIPQGSVLSFSPLFLLYITQNRIYSFHSTLISSPYQNKLYKAYIKSQMEYCSYIWSTTPRYCLQLLNSNNVKLINNPLLTVGLQSLEQIGVPNVFLQTTKRSAPQNNSEAEFKHVSTWVKILVLRTVSNFFTRTSGIFLFKTGISSNSVFFDVSVELYNWYIYICCLGNTLS